MKGKISSMWRVAIALVMVLSLSLVMAVPVAANVSTPEVTDITNQVPSNATAVYTIEFTTTEDLAIGDAIVIEFPEGTDLSTVTDVAPAGTKAVEGPRLSQTLSTALPAGDITVVVTNVTNPPVRGSSYTLKVYTSQEPTRVTSATYIIGTGVTINDVVPTTETVGTASVYTITFTPTTTLPDGDTITITFPADTYVPPSPISKAHVTVDGSACLVDATVSGRTVTVTTPVELPDSVGYDVVFLIEAGIKNPTTIDNPYPEATAPNDWTLTMYTSRDIVPVESTDYGPPFTQAGATAIKQLAVIGVDTYVLNNTVSTAMMVQAQDVYGNPTDIGGTGITINLSAEPSGGVLCDVSGGPLSPAQVTIASGTDSDAFYFKSATAGTYTITAAETPAAVPDWANGTAEVTVSPKVQLWHGGANYIPVTDDYPTFAGAIDAALPYDTIKVPAGTYEEDFIVNKAHLTIESISGKASTFLKGVTGGQDGILQLGSGANNFVLGGSSGKGFTLQGGGWSIHIKAATDVTISYNTLDFTDAEGTAGIQMTDGVASVLTVTENTFILTELYQVGVKGNCSATLSGLTVTDNTFTGAGSTVDHSAIEVENLDITTLDSTISDNEITGVMYGVNIGACCGDGLKGGSTNAGTLEISGNTFDALKYGINLLNVQNGNTDQNVVIKRNAFTNNNYGFAISDDADWEPAGFTVQYNDFSGNTCAVFNNTTDAALDAAYNYWGAATGPGDDDIGTSVESTVTYSPWLAKSQALCVTASYPALNRPAPLSVGWNTLSAPAKLISTADTIAELVPTGYDAAYWYDAFNEGGPIWRSAFTRVLNPCDAVYIKMSSAANVLFQVDGDINWPPSKDLAAGWNMVGQADLTGLETRDDAVGSVSSTYSQLVSPSMNSAEWIYTGTDTTALVVGEGYWIFMREAGTLAGFTFCPIVPAY